MHVVVVKWRQRNVKKGLMHREQNDYFWLGFVDTMLDSFLGRYETLSCMITYSIIMWNSRSTRRRFSPLQKSRQNHGSYVWTEALSDMVFLPAQKLLSGIV